MPVFAPSLGSTGAAAVVPHGVSAIPVSGSTVVPGAAGSNTTGGPGSGLFLSSFPPSMSGSQTFVMQQSVMVPSSTGSIPLPANCTLIQQPPTPTQSAPLQQISQSGGVPQSAAVQIQQAQTQSPHIQSQQSQLAVSQAVRTPTPVRTSVSPPGRAAVGLSLQQVKLFNPVVRLHSVLVRVHWFTLVLPLVIVPSLRIHYPSLPISANFSMAIPSHKCAPTKYTT